MTVTATPSTGINDSAGMANYASGGLTTDAATAAAYVLNLGFTPRKFRIINITDMTQYEWRDQMPAADSLKTVTAGTFTLDTTGAITIGSGLTDRTVTLSAGVMVASKSFVWEAFA